MTLPPGFEEFIAETFGDKLRQADRWKWEKLLAGYRGGYERGRQDQAEKDAPVLAELKRCEHEISQLLAMGVVKGDYLLLMIDWLDDIADAIRKASEQQHNSPADFTHEPETE